jgi:hypothetical protein
MRDNNLLVICEAFMVQSVKETLEAAFRYLLKPLVRLAMNNSVTFADFNGALKKAYVDVAARQMVLSGMNVTDEGISLIASIPVDEVRALLRARDDEEFSRATKQVSPIAIILNAWHTDQKYTGPYGVLRDLQFARRDGDRNSETFTELVLAYCPGISPQVLLDELLRLGAVKDVGNGFYRALMKAYVPASMSKDNILYLARVVHNLCGTIEFNVRQKAADAKGLIERSIFTQYGIPKKQHDAFDRFIREKGQVFSDDIDNWYASYDVEGIEDGMQIGVGFYHYIVNEDDEDALAKDLPN